MLERIEQFKQSFKPRKAEENDTRQDIQRHDPDFHKKKQDDGEHGFKDPYEDLTDVSVTALITFLKGLIKSPQSQTTSTDTLLYEDVTEQYRPPVDKTHATAMNAYQTRSEQSSNKPRQAVPPSDEPQTALDKAASQLKQTEINATIRDLENLLARGIDHIALERGEGFIQSIQNSIAKY